MGKELERPGTGSDACSCMCTLDPSTTVRAASLRYVNCRAVGISRRRSGRGFVYHLSGHRVVDVNVLERIRKLAIPPAWKNVWICADANGHLQATGMDVKGRRQYRYHAAWSGQRNKTKFDHILRFGACIADMRRSIDRDLRAPGMPLRKVLSTVVAVMDETHIRIGHDRYARENGSYGLSTLLDRHVRAEGGAVRFVFTGKKGIRHDIRIGSARLAKLVLRCKELPGQDLFQYVDESGAPHPIDSGMVNEHIGNMSDGAFSSKDLRTWRGTVHAVKALLRMEPPQSEAEALRNINEALDDVAVALGNTRTVCRKYYIHPTVIELFRTGRLHALAHGTRASAWLQREERILLRLLDARGRRAPRMAA